MKTPARNPIPDTRYPRHNRGIALILVMIALLLGTVLTLSFLSQQTTSTAVAQNVAAHAESRAIAESVLLLSIQHVRSSSTWRADLSNGQWTADVAFEDGTYTIWGVDGYDEDGDGAISGSETDGDLNDDNSDPVTITVVSNFQGVTHKVSATVWPGSLWSGPVDMLMIVVDPDNLTSDETSRKQLIESWGWNVALLAAASTQDEYDAAITSAHVVYVPDDGGSNTVGTRLASTTCSVVIEDGEMCDELGLASGQGTDSSNIIRIVDNTHYVTAPFPIGDLVVSDSAGTVEYPSGTVSSSVRPLAWLPGNESRVVAVVDVGQPLLGGGSAPGRRSISPFAGFDVADLNSDGQELLKRLMEWLAMAAMTHDQVAPITNWANGDFINAANGEDRLLVVTVGAETHNTITSISYGHVPLTIAAAAYESTGVGARSYIYYLREIGIAAADDNRVRITWSSSPDDEAIASRMYEHVSQTTPIRVSNTATNAGPPSISTVPLEVANGDVVIGSAQVGMPDPYTWTSPIVMGVNDINSSSTHASGDYQVTDNPGTVTVTATTPAPNRQALIGMVIQPRSQSTGSGAIPQILALYEFQETQPTVELRGHWKLDDDGSGGAMAINDDVDLEGDSVIDGYHGSSGAYGGANSDQPVILVTNTSDSGSIAVRDNATLVGSTYNDPGSNPTTVVNISGSGSISGNRYEQSVSFSLPSLSSPGGSFTNLGTRTYSSGTTTISSDTRYTDLTINNNATLRISGNVRIWVTDDFSLSNGTIEVPAGSSLQFYVADTFSISNGGRLNYDTAGAGRVTVYQYNNGRDLTMYDASIICGTVYAARDLIMEDNAAIYGAVYVYDDLSLIDDAAVHIDKDLPGFHIVPVRDDLGVNDGLAHGGVSFAQGGARAATNTALRFDGSNDFVLIPHHDDYLLHHGAVSFWFYPENLTGSHALFSKDSSGYDTGGHIHIYTSGSTLYARLETDGSSPYGTGNQFQVSHGGIPNNSWTHVTVTFGAGGLRLYVNGVLRSSASYPGALADSSGGIGNYEPLVLGAGTQNSGDLTHLPLTDFFRGRLDDVRIYTEVLDAGQVSNLYNGNPIGDRSEPSYVVRDSSGLGDPLDLFIDNTAAVTWVSGGGLTLNSGTVLRSPQPPGKVYNGITATGQFSIEMEITPSSLDSTARRLLWFGANSGSDANLDLYTRNAAHDVRVRNSATGDNPPTLESDANLVQNAYTHVLVTFDGTSVHFYHNGVLAGTSEQAGDLLNWNDAYRFMLANSPAGTYPWLGTMNRLAIYDRAMNQRQVDNVMNGLPPGDGGGNNSGGAAQVRWMEP
ncbi:MAG: LamG domain-containing protein [Phycisphaeraceae bacterium]|nr:LamG domain-containing protein [Phycisphaeraceae bacterium]